MPVFRCNKCGCMDNTALTNYWNKGDTPLLCSACDPAIGKWHGQFDRVSAKGYYLGNDGFLYHKNDVKGLSWRIRNQGLRIVARIK